jgi:mannose-6-phosphate isomerase-like protein (cupin superfamily)
LAFLAKDGFLTLHENEIRDKFYFFMLSNKNENSLIEALKKNALRKFEILPDGDYYTEAEGHYTIKNGYGLNLRDDTFEDLLFTKFKVPVCICHETPMKDNTLADRINVTSKSIGIFCDYIGGNMNVKKIADSIINSAKASELKGFVTDIEKDTIGNDNFRKVIYTGKNSQLVLMTLKPGEEIGAEIHDDVDQFFRIESGDGKVVINGNESVVKDGFAVVVPQGAKHNVVNTGDKPLKLYTIYSPPHHKDKVVYKTKTLAEASSEHFDGKTTE